MAQIDIKYQLQQGTGPIGEPIRKNTWEIEIPAVLGVLHLYAQSFTCPDSSVEKLEVRHFNGVAYLAGKPQVSDGTLNVRDVVAPDTYNGMKKWYDRVYNQDTAVMGYASDYKERGFARRYDSKGSLIRTYELVGLWPTVVKTGEYDYDSFDGVILECTVSCDYFKVA